ncbi:MAG: TIGR04283 family arsenosugar biosynthesis glycosyltransferase [Deltaproteobacteria bacterium]|nr:TIGR04283 family arsenosugar biosynthesis glycosyltransferase [Deltaproteobacteria bacterium]
MKVSVIIPALDEEAALPATLACCLGHAHEVIVADGQSDDATAKVAEGMGAQVLSCPRGRGRQQHAGALASSGGVLLFLHADTLLPEGWHAKVEEALSRPGSRWGCFWLGISPSSRRLSLVAAGANLRTRLFALPYGDQALFVRREDYFAAGGFSSLPLMEDVDLALRLRRDGGFSPARGRVLTSARRWAARGAALQTLENYARLARFLWSGNAGGPDPSYPHVR